MFKTKYYYDPKTLSYRKVEINSKSQLKRIFSFLFASMFFGTIVLLVLLNSSVINTPTELSQAREISNYKLQFEILNKKINQLNIVLDNI